MKGVQCAATFEIAYTQRDTAVGVEGTIANNVCGASNGDYQLAVRVRNENRETQSLEFLGSWQRETRDQRFLRACKYASPTA